MKWQQWVYGAIVIIIGLYFLHAYSINRQQKDSIISTYKQELIDNQSKLEAATDQMTRIKQFQVGRTDQERTTQIETQEKYILELQNNISALDQRISDLR